MRPDTAVILSAGLGTRMRPLTHTTPKPLLPLGGRPILAHALDRLQAPGVQTIIVNAHDLADQIEAFLHLYHAVVLQHEPERLDTRSTIAAMRTRTVLPKNPFYVVNGDTYRLDGPHDTLVRIAEAFQAETMDATLQLARAAGAVAETGRGDFLWPRGGETSTVEMTESFWLFFCKEAGLPYFLTVRP